MSYIGTPTSRIDGHVKVTGAAKYAGEHTVEFVYDPGSFRLGLKLAVFGALAIALAILFEIRAVRTHCRQPSLLEN